MVLRYHFHHELPKPPPRVWLSSVAWPWDELVKQPADFRRLVNNFAAFFAEHSGKGESAYRGLFAILKLTHRTNGNVVLFSQWDEDDPGPLEQFLAAMEDGMKTKAAVQTYSAGGLFLRIRTRAARCRGSRPP